VQRTARFTRLHWTVREARVCRPSVSVTVYVPFDRYVVLTRDPVALAPLPKVHDNVGVPVPVKVHVDPVHDPEVTAAGAATVTGPAVVTDPQPALLQARTA